LTLALLHVASTAAASTSLDWRVVASAVAVLAAAETVVWRPWRWISGRRGRLRTIRAVTSLLVFLAVLPAVFPYDHILPHVEDEHEDESVHRLHCHLSPGTCSDVPLTSGPGELIFSAPLLPSVHLSTVALEERTERLTPSTFAPLTPPPRG
jgi:hypothetical protein